MASFIAWTLFAIAVLCLLGAVLMFGSLLSGIARYFTDEPKKSNQELESIRQLLAEMEECERNRVDD